MQGFNRTHVVSGECQASLLVMCKHICEEVNTHTCLLTHAHKVDTL